MSVAKKLFQQKEIIKALVRITNNACDIFRVKKTTHFLHRVSGAASEQ